MLEEFLIELFLTNELSNYIKNSSKGKATYENRFMISKLIYQIGSDKYIKWSKVSAAVGRTFIAFASLK